MSEILNFKKFLKICTVTVWEEGISSCDVSLTPKNIYFLQLIICCWLELDMCLLNMTEFNPIRPGGGAQRPGWPNSQLPIRNLLSNDAQTW